LDKNIPILEKVLLLRQEEAELLNFKSHAEYILAIRMAKTPEKVLSFLNDLNEKLTPGLYTDLNKFLELKKLSVKNGDFPLMVKLILGIGATITIWL